MPLEVSVPSGLDRKETEIYRQFDPRRLPQHIAIIMDGNGRWARQRHLPRIAGHRAGVESVRSTVETAARVGIQSLTLYAFSTENWQRRPRTEVGFLMRLLRQYLKQELPTLQKNNVRLDYIGRQHELPPEVQERMNWARERDRAQHRPAAHPGPELQRAPGAGGRLPGHRARRRPQRRAGAPGVQRRADRAPSLHPQSAGTRFRDPHQRRNAPQQFPAVAGGVRRNLRDQHAVAGVPRRAPAGSDRRIPEARAPLWRAGQWHIPRSNGSHPGK